MDGEALAIGSERILLVEDDTDIARFIQASLRAGGSPHVVIIDDPTEVVERLDESRFDLIISKVMLRTIDGYDLVRILRARSDTAETPIMFLTARSRPEDVAEGYAAGANDYMTKPFDPVELIEHVRALLG